jgi:GNAT superfamily N-acetyltransferase
MSENSEPSRIFSVQVQRIMTLRRAAPSDADRLSQLINSFSHLFFARSDGSGADRFVEATTPAALRVLVVRPDINYLIGEWNDALCGATAIRKGRHLHHLFVAPAFQGRGVGKRLWLAARDAAMAAGNPGEFTVNASLNAVPVYQRFGFELVGVSQQTNGLIFQPMKLVNRAGSSAASCP